MSDGAKKEILVCGIVLVRTVQWADFPSFVDFYYTRYDEVRTNPDLYLWTHPEKPSKGDEAAWFGRLMKGILDGDAVCMVAEEDGRVVGAATVERKGFHNEDRHAGIFAIALVPGHRGRGAGDKLTSAVLEACLGKFEILYLTVVALNERGKALYRKHGFEECGRFPRAFKRGNRYLDDLVMWRSVGSDALGASSR